MRQPNKPHEDGYEDEEDCEGHYDREEADRRGCHPSWAHSGRLATDPCEICFQQYLAKEAAERKVKWDAKTPEEKAQYEEFSKELRAML